MKLPNTACSRQVGLCAFFELLSGFEFFPAPQPSPRSAHLRLTQTVSPFFVDPFNGSIGTLEKGAAMNMINDDKSKILANLETIWTALDAFYQQFSPQDWSRKHGKEWTFADMPYHLAYFNQTAIDGIREGDQKRTSHTLEEHDAWNDAHFAQRPSSQTGAKGLDYLHTTQAALRDAATRLAPETPVFLPLVIVGGWRTMTFVLDYLLYHTWLHFTESHLRFTRQLPDLPASLVNRTLNFGMQTLGECLLPEDLTRVDLVTIIQLTGAGGGSWTFTMHDGKCLVDTQAAMHADAEITTDIATHLKTSYYGMEHPLLSLLMGKTRIKGLAKSQQFQKIFAVTPGRAWNFVEAGKTPSS